MEACNRKNAFTLLEVLVALAITVLLVFVVSASLTTILRGDEITECLRQGTLLIRTLPAQFYLAEDKAPASSEKWNIRSEEVRVGDDDEENLWQVWELTPKARSGLFIPLALRVSAP